MSVRTLARLTLLGCSLLFAFCDEPTVASDSRPHERPATCVPGSDGPYEIAHVSDADTVVVRVPGRKPVTVRLIGVDAPEIDGPYRRAEPHGVASREFARSLLEDESVFLESDPSQAEVDRYGRRLAYVHRSRDCLMINGEIIRQGHGESYRKLRFRHRELFARYEQEARINRRGMWKR